MKAIRLRCENLKDPIGISFEKPRLGWVCEGGIKQSAYRITAECDGTVLWDSGKVRSSSSAYTAWEGKPLAPRSRVSWKVMLWDENDVPGDWSAPAFFERGLDKSCWKAKWISADFTPSKKAGKVSQYIAKPKKRYSIDCFRKNINIDRKIAHARIYASACGLYEICIDGKKAGNWCLAPGITDYNKRVQAQTIDITGFLSTGSHEITVMLADGWYRGSCGAWGLLDQYGNRTKFIAQIHIEYEDGSEDIICTDSTWDWSCDGPLRFADNKDGEIFDASLTPSYNMKARTAGHSVLPVPSDNVPLTEHEIFTPEITFSPSGKIILNMKQNFAGYISFSLKASKGQTLRLRFGEMLKDGELFMDNIQLKLKQKITPLQQITYICKEGENNYKTRFSIFGYQYVEIDADKEILDAVFNGQAIFQGIALYSDLEQTGFFESSNELLNRFTDAAIWSAKGNSADLPTDCPTRERHGWTGDAQIFFKSAAYLFDYRSFARKYIKDIYDWQKKDGKLPQIVPEGGVDFFMGTMNGSSGWADAGILIPYFYSELYCDKDILSEYYDRMVKYARFVERRCGKWTPLRRKAAVSGENRKYLVNYGASYGEWTEPADVFLNNWTEQVFPHAEVSTAYASYIFTLMAHIASSLGKEEDAAEFSRYGEGCKKAYQKLVETEPYSLDTDRQASLVRPLYLDLLTDEQTEFARKRLVKAMENYGWRLGTGFLSTPFILDVLKDIDSCCAYKLLENEEIPGWLSMPKQGATTIWESWEGSNAPSGSNIASLNHYSKGALVEWLFESMCGIKIDGENHFCITPVPGGNFTFAKASYQSIFGLVRSGWVRDDNCKLGYRFNITIPANCSAVIILPDGLRYEVDAGEYNY